MISTTFTLPSFTCHNVAHASTFTWYALCLHNKRFIYLCKHHCEYGQRLEDNSHMYHLLSYAKQNK